LPPKKWGKGETKGETGAGRGGKEMTNKHGANCLLQGARHPLKKQKKSHHMKQNKIYHSNGVEKLPSSIFSKYISM
jgi:hypothetical protein